MTQLFGRQVFLQIGKENQPGKSFSELRVGFRVQMSREAVPNKATIKAYNLHPDTIALLQELDVIVRLVVGYDVPRQIFRGSPIKSGVRVEKQGPDRIVIIEAQDGGREYQSTQLNISFATPTTLQQVFDEVALQLGLPTGTIRINRNISYPHGFSYTGPARTLLDRIADSTASDWFIRDGALYVIGSNEDSGEEAVVFSSARKNLIGSPTPKDNGMEVKALIEPSMRPGRLFQLESESYNGIYVAQDVMFVGDSGWETQNYVITTGKER